MIVFCPRCGAELHELLKGEWFESPVRCSDCGLAVAEPPLLLARGPAEEEVDYSLLDWEMPDRALATRALAEVDIPYRWEPQFVLVVPVVAEEEVDQLFEDLAGSGDGEESATLNAEAEDHQENGRVDEVDVDVQDEDDDDEDVDGGEEAQAAMADLFVVADRLQHAPADLDLAEEVTGLAATVDGCAPPYGIARPVWRRIQALSSAVAGGLAEGADEESVATDARALRDFLRDLV
jgi:hypothetical protein